MKTIAAVVLLGATTAGAAAEDLAPGTRVRVTGKGPIGSYAGSLVGIDDHGVRVRARDGGTFLLRLSDVDTIEVSRRRSRRAQGALVGMAVGAIVGYVAGAQSNPSGGCNAAETFCLFGRDGFYSDEASGAMLAVPAALLGGTVGALVSGEKWRRVEDGRVRVGVAASRRGGLALALRF